MRRTIRAMTLVGLVTAAGLATAGAASAAPALPARSAPPAQMCAPTTRSNAVPTAWIPVSRAEQDRRLRWDQVSRWDRDRNGRLSPAEVRAFQNAAVAVPGGPDCGRPENPPRRP